MFDYTEQEALPSWDRKIRYVCYQVNGIMDKISAQHSQWVSSTLDAQMAH